MNNHVKKFWQLCSKATSAWNENGDTHYYEPFLLAILTYVKSLPGFESDFKSCFLKLLNEPNLGIWEIVAFSMRELKWPEVRAEAEKILAQDNDYRVKQVMQDILDVYEEEWDDADMWQYYS